MSKSNKQIKAIDNISRIWLNLEETYKKHESKFPSRKEFLKGAIGYNNHRTSLSKLIDLMDNEKDDYSEQDITAYNDLVKIFSFIEKNIDSMDEIENLDVLCDVGANVINCSNVFDTEKVNRFLRCGNLNRTIKSCVNLVNAVSEYNTYIPKTVIRRGRPVSINIVEDGYWYAHSTSFFNEHSKYFKTDERMLKMGIFVSKRTKLKGNAFPILFLEKSKFAIQDSKDENSFKLPLLGKGRFNKFDVFEGYNFKRIKFGNTNVTVVLI